MPINKCAPRLKLQYTVQIQQSEWHSPCTAHQRVAPLQTEHHASSNCALTSKTLTKMGSKPRDRWSDRSGEMENNWGREKSWLLWNLKIPNLKNIKFTYPMVVFKWPQFCPQICNFRSLNLSLYASCRSQNPIVLFLPVLPLSFFPLSPPSLLCCLFQSLTLSLGKRS